MGEFLAELGLELLGELLEVCFGLFLYSKRVNRWVKTLVVSILAALLTAGLAAAALLLRRHLVLTALMGLFAAAVGILCSVTIIRGHRNNWIPKESVKKRKTGRKCYDP